MVTQNIYEYKKVKILDTVNPRQKTALHDVIRNMRNKINELVIEQNHLMKDFELYKKAFKKYVSEHP